MTDEQRTQRMLAFEEATIRVLDALSDVAWSGLSDLQYREYAAAMVELRRIHDVASPEATHA